LETRSALVKPSPPLPFSQAGMSSILKKGDWSMQFNDLPVLEREAIGLLLQHGDSFQVLQRQLDSVIQVRRTETGAGVYVTFEFEPEVERLAGHPSFHIADVFATSSRCEEIGFILFVNEGLVDCMEAYVYADVYPSYDNCNFRLSRQADTHGMEDPGA